MEKVRPLQEIIQELPAYKTGLKKQNEDLKRVQLKLVRVPVCR
jgi:hypothetical protein